MWNVAAIFEVDENLQNDFLIFEAAPNVSDHKCAQKTYILTHICKYTHRHMYNINIHYVLTYMHKHVHIYKLQNSYRPTYILANEHEKRF